MSEHAFQLTLLFSSALFAGVILFVAEVLGRIFLDMSETEFGRFMRLLYRRAGYSVFVVTVATIPFIGLLAYPFFYGFREWPFLLGLLLFNIGSTVSKYTNAPVYRAIIAASETTDTTTLSRQRLTLVRLNILRAVIYGTSVLLMFAVLF